MYDSLSVYSQAQIGLLAYLNPRFAYEGKCPLSPAATDILTNPCEDVLVLSSGAVDVEKLERCLTMNRSIPPGVALSDAVCCTPFRIAMQEDESCSKCIP